MENLRSDLDRLQPDFVFADKCSELIGALDAQTPLMYRSDSTFAQMVGYYPEYQGLDSRTIEYGNALETAALQRSQFFLPPTHWAADGARSFYGHPPDRCSVVRSHASLLSVAGRNDREIVPGRGLEVLFIGSETRRKGLRTAVLVVQALRDRGWSTRLNLVTRHRPGFLGGGGPDWLRWTPWIDRSTRTGRDAYEALFAGSDLLLAPATAECFGQTLVDGLLHGVPVVACRTGGVTETVVDGSTGLLLPVDASAEEFAERIAAAMGCDGWHRSAAEASRRRYERYFSLERWSRDMRDVFACLAERKKA